MVKGGVKTPPAKWLCLLNSRNDLKRFTSIGSRSDIVVQDSLDIVGAADPLHLPMQLCGAGKIAAVPEQVLAHTKKTVVLHDVFVMPAMFEHDVETLGETHVRLRRYCADSAKGLLHLFFTGEKPRISLGGLADENAVDLAFANAPVDFRHVQQVTVAEEQRPGVFCDLGRLRDGFPIGAPLCIPVVTCARAA